MRDESVVVIHVTVDVIYGYCLRRSLLIVYSSSTGRFEGR